MNEIPIFDSLTHPTRDGAWLGREDHTGNTFEEVLEQMSANNVYRALAVGMGSTGQRFDPENHISSVREVDCSLVPIAFLNSGELVDSESVHRYLDWLRQLGYPGVKIHPRLAGIDYRHDLLPTVLAACGELGLVVLLCTYNWDDRGTIGGCTPYDLARLLGRSKTGSVILMHGGGPELLRYAEIVRHFPKTLLDLSFTLGKFEGSSVDLDIAYLFRTFDQRICIGSDSPEFSLKMLRRRFNELGRQVDRRKLENIAYRNLATLFPDHP